MHNFQKIQIFKKRNGSCSKKYYTFFQKIQNITIQNLHFTQMFTIITTMGTPSMIQNEGGNHEFNLNKSK